MSFREPMIMSLLQRSVMAFLAILAWALIGIAYQELGYVIGGSVGLAIGVIGMVGLGFGVGVAWYYLMKYLTRGRA